MAVVFAGRRQIDGENGQVSSTVLDENETASKIQLKSHGTPPRMAGDSIHRRL